MTDRIKSDLKPRGDVPLSHDEQVLAALRGIERHLGQLVEGHEGVNARLGSIDKALRLSRDD